MTRPHAMTDEEFLAAFLDCTIPPEAFDHRGHVRVAWLLLQRYPLAEAVERICDGIARLAAHLGAPEKYNRTLSEALVRLMAHGGAGAPALSWEEFVNANDLLMANFRDLLARHYSEERLAAPEARERFLAPDRLPLPSCAG